MVKIRKQDISELSHSELVNIVWSLQKDAEWYANMLGSDEGWDLCVITPSLIRHTIEKYLS